MDRTEELCHEFASTIRTLAQDAANLRKLAYLREIEVGLVEEDGDHDHNDDHDDHDDDDDDDHDNNNNNSDDDDDDEYHDRRHVDRNDTHEHMEGRVRRKQRQQQQQQQEQQGEEEEEEERRRGRRRRRRRDVAKKLRGLDDCVTALESRLRMLHGVVAEEKKALRDLEAIQKASLAQSRILKDVIEYAERRNEILIQKEERERERERERGRGRGRGRGQKQPQEEEYGDEEEEEEDKPRWTHRHVHRTSEKENVERRTQSPPSAGGVRDDDVDDEYDRYKTPAHRIIPDPRRDYGGYGKSTSSSTHRRGAHLKESSNHHPEMTTTTTTKATTTKATTTATTTATRPTKTAAEMSAGNIMTNTNTTTPAAAMAMAGPSRRGAPVPPPASGRDGYGSPQEIMSDIELRLVSESEFGQLSRATRGRITIAVVNDAVVDIERTARKKYSVLRRCQNPHYYRASHYHSTYQKLWTAHLDLLVDEHGDRPWVSEQDLRQSCAFFRSGESTARGILAILRTLKRLRQVSGRNSAVTYILLNDDDDDDDDDD